MRCVLARLARNVMVAGAVNVVLFAAASSGCSGADEANTTYTPPAPVEDASAEADDASSELSPDVVQQDGGKDVVDAKDALPPPDAADAADSAKDAAVDTQQDVVEEPVAADAQEEEACNSMPEICNGLDDNCNGQKDEGNPGGNQSCEVTGKLGECKAGTTQCQNGQLKCIQTNLPGEEFCDGLDNDCDGQIDDNTSDTGGACNTGLDGVCAMGTEICQAGTVVCKQNLQPSDETCNGLDDNCNGGVDEGFSGAGDPCQVPGQVANTPCATGQTNCLGGQNGCTQTVFPFPELCDGADNDCDGTIDNPSVLEGKACDSGLPGVCQAGKTQCSAGVASCVPDVAPGTVTETCNAKDDNCNGMADDVANIKLECATKYPTAQNVLDWKCTTGNCEVAQCSGAYKDCDTAPANGCEVNSLSDLSHCGQCGLLCNTNHGTPSCVSGACQIACNNGWGNCNGLVTDGCELPLSSDVSNCGACGNQCEATTGTPSCQSGICSIVCAAGLGNCDGNIVNGCETNLNTDPLHCGSCPNVCSTSGGTASCAAGKCQIACSPGMGNCDNNVTNGCEDNLNSDPSNCGACGTACSNTNGTPGCFGGQCTITCAANYGNCDNDVSDGCETNLKSSVDNCNGCGNACSTNHGTPSCVNGACTIACASGYGNCDGDVTNGCETPLTTNANCGACGQTCNLPNATESCSTGTCTLTACTTGYGNCDNDPDNGCEVTFSNDPSHCGSCTKVCSTVNGTPSCVSGTCRIACASGFGNCDNNADNGCEINLQNSTSHCNGCGQACSSVNGTPLCTNGVCSITCSTGFKNCDASAANGCEVNSNTDEANCGVCGKVCSTSHATSVCTSGVCVLTCAANFADCDTNPDNGCEASLLNDALHCGNCLTSCSSTGGTPSCNNGVCGITCASGMGDCNPGIAGCETNINSSLTNCGGCGIVCSSTNGTPACSGGICSISCTSGYGNCDGNVANGCETTFASDPLHCGNCTTACNSTNGVATCSGGTCGITCNTNFANCNNNANDGCEVNLKTDPLHCNSCTTACNATNGTPACNNGVCSITCNPGYYNCDSLLSNGCEVNTNNDVNNCGACGKKCSAAGGTATCSGGTCYITCSSGFGDCNNNVSDGCEVNLTSDPLHCGLCTTQCNGTNGTPTCSASACGISCFSGYANCDGNAANGCEINLTNDPVHCGSCTTVCSNVHGTPTCISSTCGIICASGYGDCTSAAGCETNTTNNVLHCGACGAACSTVNGVPTCSANSCSIACNSGYGNCDGAVANGCETNTNTDVTHCGNCTNNCTTTLPAQTSSAKCSSGSCAVNSCATGYYDQNLLWTDGCECQADSVGNTCAGASPVNSGTAIGVNTTAPTITGNILPSGDTDWYVVKFDVGPSCGFNPKIVLTDNTGQGIIKMRVYSNCSSGTVSCNVAGDVANSGSGETTYEFTYSSSCYAWGPIDYYPDTGSFITFLTPDASLDVTLYVQVYATASHASCMSYSLVASN